MLLSILHTLLQIVLALATTVFAIIVTILTPNIIYWGVRLLDPKEHAKGGRPPNEKPKILWTVFWLCLITFLIYPIVSAGIDNSEATIASAQRATLTVTPLLKVPPTFTVIPSPNVLPTTIPTSIIFTQPAIFEIADGDLPGYSKQSSFVRDSQGKLTLFIRYESSGDLGYIESFDSGKTWSEPKIFARITPPGGPQLSAAIDSADQIHIVWGRAPEAGEANYGLLSGGKWKMINTVGTGVFARDITVDSANHPHIVWTNIDLFSVEYNGQNWSSPKRIVYGVWHPDIQVDSKDNLRIFANNAYFYPTPGSSVYAIENANGDWKTQKLSTSPFWSGGAAAIIDSQDNIYITWIGSTTNDGGQDEVYFSRYINGEWQIPFQIGELNTSAGSTGQESPAIAFDANNMLYVFWRGLNNKNRPVIFARVFVTKNNKVYPGTSGWSRIIELDYPSASDIWWPSIANVQSNNRVIGVDVVWRSNIGTKQVIVYSHVSYP